MEVAPRIYRVVGDKAGTKCSIKNCKSLHQAKMYANENLEYLDEYKNIRIDIVDKATGAICETFYL